MSANLTTPQRIIAYAMQDAGLLQDGDNPNSEQFAKYSNRLLDLINLWQTQGMKLWTNVDTPIPLVAGQASYNLGPAGDVDMTKPLRGLQGYYLDVNSNKVPLICISWNEYLNLSNVTTTGALNSYFINKQQSYLQVRFWNTPDATAATGVAHILLQRQLVNFTQLNDTIDFPLEWMMALRWGLADDICTGQPQAIMDRCAQRAEAYRTALENFDVEDADTRFSPDQRSAYATGGFR